jgi:hypothetical protein
MVGIPTMQSITQENLSLRSPRENKTGVLTAPFYFYYFYPPAIEASRAKSNLPKIDSRRDQPFPLIHHATIMMPSIVHWGFYRAISDSLLDPNWGRSTRACPCGSTQRAKRARGEGSIGFAVGGGDASSYNRDIR